MSTREDLQRFLRLGLEAEKIGLEPMDMEYRYFCTPVGAEPVGRTGGDGIHFVLLPGDERVFCVNPTIFEIGRYVLPVAESFRQFLSFVLYCRDADALSDLSWMDEEQFRACLAEGRFGLARQRRILCQTGAGFGSGPGGIFPVAHRSL